MRIITSTILLALVLASACATTTKIVSEPPGATVTEVATKKELGKTPLTYESKMWIWEAQQVELKAPGRKAKTVELKRSELDALPMVGGICLAFLPPCFLLQGLPIVLAGGLKMPETTTVKLDPGGDAPPVAPAAMLDGSTSSLVCQAY